MPEIAKAYAMSDVRISFVSLVDKAANKRQFLVTKAEDGSASFRSVGRIIKADANTHEVTGIVYEPMTEDTDGNYMTEEEIVKAAHWFMKNSGGVDLQHSFAFTKGQKWSRIKLNAAIEMQMRDKRSQTLADAIIDNHEALAYYSPEEMKSRLERAGYNVEPLGRGSCKDLKFEDGGGYRIYFGNDGYLQYHPNKGHHHKGAYWKIGNGQKGMRRYNLDGTPKYD